MICPKCGSNNVSVQAVTNVKTKHRGCLMWCLWILLAICTCGLILIIPAITNSKTKSKTHTEALCQNCGYRWKVTSFENNVSSYSQNNNYANTNQPIQKPQNVAVPIQSPANNTQNLSSPMPTQSSLVSSKDYKLFGNIVDDYILKYQYEQNICTKNMTNIIKNIECAGKEIFLKDEPNNQYDTDAIAIFYNGQKIGYVFKGNINSMIHDWNSKNYKYICYLNKIDLTNYKLTFKIGFYIPEEQAKSLICPLSKTSKKIDDDMKRTDNLDCCTENDEVSLELDYETDCYFVYDSNYNELGELSASTQQKLENVIGNNSIDNLFGKIISLEQTESGSYKCKIKIYY